MKYCQQYQGGVHRLTRPTIIYDYYRYFRISPVWQEFDKLPGGISARCKIYHIKYKTGGGTSNLRNHLKKKHKLTVTPDKKAESSNEPQKYGQNSRKKRRIDVKIGLMVAVDYQPLNVVDNPGFQN